MKMRTRRLMTGAGVAALVAGMVAAQPATVEADVASANLSVSAAVAANCTISAGSLLFGTYDPIGANDTNPLNAEATVTVRCTKNTSAQVGLDNGENFSGGRRMIAGASQFLSYELYSDSTRNTVWNMANRVNYVAPNRSPQDLTVYGQVPAGQDVEVGNYSDTVIAEIEF